MGRRRAIEVDEINKLLDVIENVYNLERGAIKSPAQKLEVWEPRNVFYFIANKWFYNSAKDIANFIGRKYHRCVIHGKEQIAFLKKYDKRLDKKITEIGEQYGLSKV